MCDPVTLGSIALTALGTGASYMGQQEVQSARDDALSAERIRQQGLDQQAAALNTQSQDRYQDFGAKQQEKSASLADYYKTQSPMPEATAQTVPQSSSNLVVANEAAKKAEAKQRTDQIGTALGGLRSFGDLLGNTSILQARDASKIGQVGNFKKGSSNVLSYELEDANSAGSGLSALGQIASGLGRVGVSAGLSGAGGNLFGGASNVVNPASYAAGGSRALGGALDRASVGGYAGYGKPGLLSLFGG